MSFESEWKKLREDCQLRSSNHPNVFFTNDGMLVRIPPNLREQSPKQRAKTFALIRRQVLMEDSPLLDDLP